MKKIISTLLVAAMAVSLAACGGSSSGSSSSGSTSGGGSASSGGDQAASTDAFDDYARPTIVASDADVSVIYLISNMTDESNIRPENQVAIEAAHRGWDYQLINYETEDNFRQYFDNAIQQQPTAIICGITQSFGSYQDLVEKARNAGIGVYSVDNSVIPGVIANATLDNKAAAKELMEVVTADHPGINIGLYTLGMSEILTNRAEAVTEFADNSDVKILETIDLASTGDLNTAGYTIAQTWLEQFGDDLDCIICNADTPALSAAEAIIQAGKQDKVFVTGVDGGSSTWAYMRQDSPVKYTYSQPFEYFSHNICELISQIQVQGLVPGDGSCLISEVGEYITAPGIVTTVDNVPQSGDSIHSVFGFYGEDPNADAWYNWTDGPGIYQVQD